ncbi:BlaI/MecI/CopY family transcriptional regulator, partial [Mycobacterium tuberculosis]|nr:BlaI/MecI/CopY family transcriptional regulator [Mycobacterium tuberculosis]
IHTVLTRLEKKGFVTRDRSVRPHRYIAVSTREDHVAELMTEVLSQAPDRQAVLARFLGTVTEADENTLRNLLGRNHSSRS